MYICHWSYDTSLFKNNMKFLQISLHMESGVLPVTLRANIKYFINATDRQSRH